MDNFIKIVLKEIEERKLIEKGKPLIVGVSGGADSMVLLYVLREIASIFDAKLMVAHFNHKLRGIESDADECFVKDVAQKFGLECRVGSGNVRILAEKEGLSIEMAARILRHNFLAQTAKEFNANAIALGHHGSDQVELFFLRLLRGSGARAMRGMRWKSPSPADASIKIIRPLLGFLREDILEYAHSKGISYRTDCTNTDVEYLRNRIRHQLIPLLRTEYQSALERIILREMEILGSEDEYLDKVVNNILVNTAVKFNELPIAIQRRLIHTQLIDLGIIPEFDLIEQLRLKECKFVSAGMDFLAKRSRDGKIKVIAKDKITFTDAELSVELNGGSGVISFGGIKVNWEKIKGKSIEELLSQKPFNCEFFDADKIGSKIQLRHWRAGDKFQPIGLRQELKLQDFFINNKVPREKRHRFVLGISESGKIFWVESLRISELHKVDDKTQTILKWIWERTS